jgi:hypothetical protein
MRLCPAGFGGQNYQHCFGPAALSPCRSSGLPFTRPVCRNDVDQFGRECCSAPIPSAVARIQTTCHSSLSRGIYDELSSRNLRYCSFACARVAVSRLPDFEPSMTVMWAYTPPYSSLPRATEQSYACTYPVSEARWPTSSRRFWLRNPFSVLEQNQRSGWAESTKPTVDVFPGREEATIMISQSPSTVQEEKTNIRDGQLKRMPNTL